MGLNVGCQQLKWLSVAKSGIYRNRSLVELVKPSGLFSGLLETLRVGIGRGTALPLERKDWGKGTPGSYEAV